MGNLRPDGIKASAAESQHLSEGQTVGQQQTLPDQTATITPLNASTAGKNLKCVLFWSFERVVQLCCDTRSVKAQQLLDGFNCSKLSFKLSTICQAGSRAPLLKCLKLEKILSVYFPTKVSSLK